MQVSCLVEIFGSQTGIPKSLKKNQKFQRGGGVNDFGIWRAWGVEHFGISKAREGGCKMSTPHVVGYGYFLESPIMPYLCIYCFLTVNTCRYG